MTRERGSGKTPIRVTERLKEEVSEKSMLAVSKATGLGLAAIGRYLKGIGEPTTATLEKLADYFGVTVAWLRGEEPSERIIDIAGRLNSDVDDVHKYMHEIGLDEAQEYIQERNVEILKEYLKQLSLNEQGMAIRSLHRYLIHTGRITPPPITKEAPPAPPKKPRKGE